MAPYNPLTKAKTYPPTNIHQTYSIAHTAKCKLSIAADAPDRNLRFLLGHAMTLDNALIRIVEIENSASDEEPEGDKSLGVDPEAGQDDALSGGAKGAKSGSLSGGKVRFGRDDTGDAAKDAVPAEPEPVEDLDYDDEDDGMGLQRFPSAAAAPPRMVPSTEEDSDEDDDGPVSPPSLPSDFDYKGLMQGPVDEELGGLFEEVRSCPCHGHADDVKGCKKIWDVKEPQMGGRRLAVMEVEA